MSLRVSLVCLLVLALFASWSVSAPAPLTPPVVGDALVALRDPAALAQIQKRLRSRDFLAGVLRDEAVRRLGVPDLPDPEAWLKARLRIQPFRGGTALRIGLADCTVAEALTVLSAVTNCYLDDVYRDRREQLRDYEVTRALFDEIARRRNFRGAVTDEQYRQARQTTERLRAALEAQAKLILRGPRASASSAR